MIPKLSPLVVTGMVGVGLLIVAGCSGQVAMPTSYQNYNAKDQSFAIDYPANWEAVGGGQSGFYSARFTSGSASVKVSADMTGSVVADIAKSQATMAGGENIEELKPIVKVHAMGKQQMAEEWGKYEENEPANVNSGFGESRQSEFKASSGFGGKVRGSRLTALSVDRRITVVAVCKERDWDKLKPVFDKMIASLQRGR